MSLKLSRPSSAASQRSQRSYVSNSSIISRFQNSKKDINLECKAAFLTVLDDIQEAITNKSDFLLILQQTGRNPSQKYITEYWRDGRDHMTYDELVDVCHNIPQTSMDDLMRAFIKIDINGDGYLSFDELYKIMTMRGEKLSPKEVKMMIDEVDDNKDGRLDYNEFCKMFVSTTEECREHSLKVMVKKEQLWKRLSSPSVSAKGIPHRQPHNVHFGKPVISDVFQPKDLHDWNHSQSKGCFFVDANNGFVSHRYSLTLTDDSLIWITVQPLNSGRECVDTALYILQDGGDGECNQLITFTDRTDGNGCYAVSCNLCRGSYYLVPFTSGCHLRARNSEPPREAKLVDLDRKGKVTLTKAFMKALERIFDISDLDGNNLLSREEFNWFNIRTSGEEVEDDEWEVVEENIEMVSGEITKQGFIKLNEMEADDMNGETGDLWITLVNMGFNKSLEMDEACPFIVNVYSEDGEVMMKVADLQNVNNILDPVISSFVLSQGKESPLDGMKDLKLFTYMGDTMASVVVENKSVTAVNLQLNFNRSCNVLVNQADLVRNLAVAGTTHKLVMLLLPRNNNNEWSVCCDTSILK